MDILQFLNSSYTAFHTARNVCDILDGNGFVRLNFGDKWVLNKGGKYYVTANGSSVVAFVVGDKKAYNICISHTDSPALKVKGGSLIKSNGVTRLNTEQYGGGLWQTFFDRPLKVCGRLLVRTDSGVEQQVVTSSYNVVIPSLAIHHNPKANEGIAINLQNDTLPLFCQGEKELYRTLTDREVLDADLFVAPASEAFYAGAGDEFLCSARLDNLTSVYTSIEALCATKPKNIAVVACLDNEEVGSGTRQGSPSLIDRTLRQIESALGMGEVEAISAREQGMALSVDNGHAVHPAHPEKSDPDKQVHLNGGVVIKHHVNYATDGLSSAIFKRIIGDKVPVQDYYNRSDLRSGTTLGLNTARTLGIITCDVGLAQLSMHSACETVGSSDLAHMKKALRLFLSATLSQKGDAVILK